MNKYIKPTFIVASLGINAMAAGTARSCDYKITADDKDWFESWDSNWEENLFHSEEGCVTHYDQFCKFSAGDDTSLGVENAFMS